MILSINPATGREIERFAPFTVGEVDARLDAAARAQKAWRFVPIAERVNLLTAIATQLRRDRSVYARLIVEEMGKPIGEAEAEIDKCVWACEYYAEVAPQLLADEAHPSSATKSLVAFEPLGVVLAIMPWNFPFWQFIRFAAPALAAGNGIVLKHASNVPRCALALAALLAAANAPDGLMQTLLIDASAVAGLIGDDRIAAVTLTGSTEVGAIVAAQAGKALKKQVLELGGSDPFIVLADADIDRAAAVAVKARFTNAGQSCVNAKRFLVEAVVADRFAEAFCANVQKLRLGDPRDPATDIGPLARANLRGTLHRQVEASVAAGAALRLGGRPVDGPGYYYLPTVLDNVRPDHAAFREETFGPVAAIIRVEDAEDAVHLANQTEYGLGAAIWTSDAAKSRVLAARLDVGAVFINGMVASDPRLPFGGVKKSGYGRELGNYGIREFVNVKTIWIGPAR